MLYRQNQALICKTVIQIIQDLIYCLRFSAHLEQDKVKVT